MAPDHTMMITEHSILMAIGWLVLVPVGVWMSTVGKKAYPSSWRCCHASIMLVATTVILTAASLCYYHYGLHFSTVHQIVSAFLNGLIVVQAAVGIYMYWKPQGEGPRPVLNSLHRLSGMVLYLGGLGNGIYGLHMYLSGMPFDHCLYKLSIAFGFFLGVQLALLCQILPAWWQNCGDEHNYVQIPELLPTSS
jgi:hypothetical protein